MTRRVRGFVVGFIAVAAMLYFAVVVWFVLIAGPGPAPSNGTRWESEGAGAFVTLDGGRIEFYGLAYVDKSVSCDAPSRMISGSGRVVFHDFSMSVLLDEPLTYGEDNPIRRVNIALVALGPRWDQWSTIALPGCDAEGSDAFSVLARVSED